MLSIVSAVGNTLFLGFWTAESIPGFKQGHYMAVYGGLGVALALITFVLCFSFTYVFPTRDIYSFSN
jgi:ATP-binding cassette subfamily C (CFTR/MRP) protein 1